MYDFTTLRPRRGMGAGKWSALERAGVTEADVIPFSVADMDLLAAPEITAAIKEAADFGVYGYTGSYTGYFGLCATKAAYQRGEAWLEELLAHIWGNYEYAKTYLNEKFPSVSVYPMEGTYLLWADFSSLGLPR